MRTVLGKFLCCSITLASGIPLGREGPGVQIGAGIASTIGRRFGLSAANVKALVPVGCAAALAAAFNTPIAAVLFAPEEILGDMQAPVLGSVVLSSATSWMVLHLTLGDQPLFHVPSYQLVNPIEFGVYVILGIVGGQGSGAFVRLLLKLRLIFIKLPKWTVPFQQRPQASGPRGRRGSRRVRVKTERADQHRENGGFNLIARMGRTPLRCLASRCAWAADTGLSPPGIAAIPDESTFAQAMSCTIPVSDTLPAAPD